MAEVGIKELLQAGVHFGHQTRRWNPRMRRYILGEREGIHVIDLLQTEELLKQATEFVTEIAGKGGVILFVGTKKQARDSVEEWAEKCGMPYVNRRWLGGLLTNFHTIKQRIKRLHELRELKEDGRLELLPTKERMSMERELREARVQPRRRRGHAAPARRGRDRRPEDRGDRRCARHPGWRSRSSAWSTPTAIRAARST